MAHHHIAHVSLSPQQVVRLGSGLGIQLRHHQLTAGQHEVHLTHHQATRLARATQAGKGVRLQLSEQQLRRGGGFLDQLKRIGRIAKAVITRHLPGPRETIPPAVRSFLAKHGQERVTQLAVGRSPVHSVITKLLNLLSLGKFDEVRKELGVVTVWHTFLLMTLSSGKQVVLEKNHVVQLEGASQRQLDAEHLQMALHAHPTLQQVVERAEKRQPGFWLYSHSDNSCQQLVHVVLASMPEIGKSETGQADAFFKQNGAALSGALGVVGNAVARKLTDLAASGDRLLHGDGLQRRQVKKKIVVFR